ncbi:receptor-type tyrosine-protein phosphatase beta [Halichoeres trimaculatus]|uniref:receptor-type tyrosine-protein phosphatase beta n=1 Tax=Halichoeres trimaculatus TaxID=147232 RepID=UPI003D9E5CAE
MTLLVRLGVSLLLLCAALPKISEARCDGETCAENLTETLTVNMTTVVLGSNPNCNLSIENQSSGKGSIPGLIPGAVYSVFFDCFNCCKEVTTKPSAVTGLNAINVTTSSMLLIWTKPNGNSSSYKVHWTDGIDHNNDTVSETSKTITNLTAGVQYNVSVTAVADDGLTEGDPVTVSKYTKPEVVRDLSVVTATTSSISLNWTEPEGKSSLYRVKWTNGATDGSKTVTETNINVTELTAGVQYSFTVIAVAGDNTTESAVAEISHYTKPEVVRDLSVVTATTSSISLNWTEPEGKSSLYRMKWTNGATEGNQTVTETNINVTELTAGVQYSFTVIAVAGDNTTESAVAEISHYTKPEVVRDLSVVTATTSSISLNWTEPEGKSSLYRVKWTNGATDGSKTVTETNINVTELTAGVQYSFTVIAVAGDNTTESAVAEISHYTKPEVVRNLTVMNVTTSSMFVDWTEPEGESSVYRVQWKSINGKMNWSCDVTETHINITNLTAGVQYEISVSALVENGSTKGESTTVSPYTKPEVVRDLSVVTATTSSISLNWTEPEGKSSLYRVRWTNGATDGSKTVTKTNINVTELTAGVQYSFTVIAVAGDNTTESAVAEISHYTKPEVVRNLTVMNVTTSSMFVDWTEPEGESSVYRVQWKSMNGKMNWSSDVTETHINITNLTAGVQYEISVSALVENGSTKGESTTVSHYTKPEVVRDLSVVTATTSSISLNWTEPEGKSSLYRVRWTNEATERNQTVTETNINVTELTAGVQYSFTVIAVAGDNTTESAVAEISHYTKPEVVRNLTVMNVTTSSMFVDWTEPEGESSVYRVQWKSMTGKMNWSCDVTETHINITNLTAGVQYEISVSALVENGSAEGESTTVSRYTKPEVVRDLSVVTATTSSISLNWTEPEGKSSLYRVKWTNGATDGNQTVTETNINVTELTAGVQYSFTVIAVAGDNTTESAVAEISHYTKPGKIGSHSAVPTSSSISLNWTAPPGEVSRYKIEWHNGGSVMEIYIQGTSTVISDLSPGTSYTIQISAENGANEAGEPFIFTSDTKPDVVKNLTIDEVTTSSVSLTWTRPEGNATSYIVQWIGEGKSDERTTNETSFNITGLSPGFQYTITVSAVSGDPGNKGQGNSKTTFTKPVAPASIEVKLRGTDNLNIHWTLPGGRVDYYVASISNKELEFFYYIKTTETSFHFTGLKPGRVYVITVTSVAGNFSETSEASFATYPTSPGPIIISSRTVSSLHAQWAIPAEMVGAPNISYFITYNSSPGGPEQNTTTTVNQTVLSQLSSGTLYSISVQAVGPEDLKSPAVYESAYTTPYPVLNLESEPKSATSVEVKWSAPLEVQAYYKYSVKAVSSTGEEHNQEVNSTSTDITGLEPGTRYNISVRTIAAPGIESDEENTFNYTFPEPVTNLTLTATTTTVELSWQRQSDHKPSYFYWVQAYQDNKLIQNNSTNTETFTFYNLCPGEFYTFKVITVVEGVPSAEMNKSSNTWPAEVPISSFSGNTTSLSVTWTAAGCHVDSYTVRLYRNELLVDSNNLNDTTVSKLFVGLKPGVLYCTEVVSTSGPFENTSSSVCNATFPNPPGPIMVESQTEDTINFTWSLPEDMDHRMYNFSLSSSAGSGLTENSWFLLENLESGSPYSISVVTVGVMNYESTAVMKQSYTRPYPVTLQKNKTQITTNSVTLFWVQRESKPHFTYMVQASNNNQPETVTDTSKTINGLLSGTNYSFTVTTQTADGTKAAPETVSYFTRPYGIRGLNANTINTTAVGLTWTEPLEYKPEYTYRVETTDCDSLKKQTISENSTQISELTPGTECSFCVTVRAADNTEGEKNCTPQYTKPEIVQPSISSLDSNSSVKVQWDRPAGRVERYKVHLNSTTGADREEELDPSKDSIQFDGLSAGMAYSAVVTTISGPFSETSGHVTNATFPNPPGKIEVLKKTTSSLHIMWGEAPLMTGASFFYRLSDISAQRGNDISVNSTSHTFTALLSGTPYNISVATEGAMGFQSDRVQISMVNTRPFSVTSLRVSETGEDNIKVTWNNPDQYKESYRFNLTWQSSDGQVLSDTAQDNIFSFKGLTSGTRYNISVTTQTADGTQSDTEQTSNCTKASPVTNFTCKGPNKKNAELILTWDCPRGLHSGFQVSVNGSNPITPTHPHCNHTVTSLSHYTQYSVTVKTQSCGLPSSPMSQLCWTGITDPPIPAVDDKSLVSVKEKLHNKFSLQINSSLLNSTNGPITHVGVLVTDKDLDTSVFRQYLGETYDNWKAEKTLVYLATVRDMNPQSRSGDNLVNIVVGDGSVWEGYSNGVLEASTNYKVAVVIFTNLDLQNKLVNGEQSLVSVLLYSADIHLPVDPAVIGLAVGATLGIFCILFIILIGFIVYWRRISNKESPDIQFTSMSFSDLWCLSAAVRVEDFEAHYKKQKADSNCGFAEEFEDLKVVGIGQSKTNALTLENKPKNRYNNVLPYDSSRVKLSIIHGSPHDDYINANYMPGYNSRKEFIAAQGPLPHTTKEFWRMIWEKNVQTLVMLTRCNEQGRVKCEQYWAPGTKHFENIIVTTASEIPLKDWTIRDFNVKNVKTAETRSVRHFHFTAWPDHGVPETTELLISFRHLVRDHMDQYSGNSPTVVHCSAGVGRTGTFIAIDHLINQIERENTVDVYGIVHDLRMHRPLMVQTEDQYVFLNQCAIDFIRSRTGNNVDLIYQNTAALCIYENIEPIKNFSRNGY